MIVDRLFESAELRLGAKRQQRVRIVKNRARCLSQLEHGRLLV